MQDAQFEAFGLLAERLADGRTVCNIEIIGGLAGLYVSPEWGRHCGPSFLMALSVVVPMTNYVQHILDKELPWVKDQQGELMFATIMLDDGLRVPLHISRMSRMLENEFIAAAKDPNTLTLPMQTIKDALRAYAHQIYHSPA